MPLLRLPFHSALDSTRRLGVALRASPGEIAALEWACLAGCGLLSASAVAFLDFNLRIPGHAILRAVVPMALGLALVPRHGSGVAMGASALCGMLALRGLGWGGAGIGAATSLALVGPLLDAALWRARRGWQLPPAFAAAGLLANLGAYLVRGGGKIAGWDHLGTRPLSEWWSSAMFSYSASGILAGLLSSALWFGRDRRPQGAKDAL